MHHPSKSEQTAHACVNEGVDSTKLVVRRLSHIRQLCWRSTRSLSRCGETVLLACSPARWACPVRRYLPELIKLVLEGKINPGEVFDLTLPLEQVAEGYRALGERRAIKTLLQTNGKN